MKQNVPSWKAETKKRPPLHHDPCTYCKETGHWRIECQRHRGPSKGSKKLGQPEKKGTSLSWPSKTLLAWLEQKQTKEDWAR